MNKRLSAAAIVLLGLALSAAAIGRYSQDAVAKDDVRGSRARTLVTISSPVDGFAQNERFIGWIERVRRPLSVCPLVLQDLQTGDRRRIARGRRCDGWPEALVLARSRGFWLVTGGSNLQKYALLLTASPQDPRIREVAFQSVGDDELLVPPVSDGRNVYFCPVPKTSRRGRWCDSTGAVAGV